jgi:hypothetical protein
MTAQKGKSLVKFAKGKGKETKIPAKPKVVAPVEKPLTPEEERDIKAKEKVASLLEGVDLTLKKDPELLEVAPEEAEDEVSNDVDWLQEQVQKLAEDNDRLKSEAEVAKGDYAKIYDAYQQLKGGVSLSAPDGNTEAIRLKVVQLFNEIQAQHLSLRHNFIIYPEAFLNRLIVFFPFLDREKRY